MDVLTPKSGIETGSSDFYKMTFTDMKVFVASLKQILCNSENIQTLIMKHLLKIFNTHISKNIILRLYHYEILTWF